MNMADKNKVMVFLFLCCAGIMVLPFIASCGKSGAVSPSSLRIQMQVVNLSPDLQPVNLYMGAFKQTGYFAYPSASGYFSVTAIDTPIRIKSYSQAISSVNILSLDTLLKPNLKYTLFITGLRIDSTITSIFTVDTAATPAVGRGKIRFVNASPRSKGFDVLANGVMAFTNQTYKNVSKFIQVPPGTYDFKILPKGLTTVVSDFPNVTIADGKIYTLYCRGIAGGADSVAFGTGIISNK
jgi:hypothetical protein